MYDVHLEDGSDLQTSTEWIGREQENNFIKQGKRKEEVVFLLGWGKMSAASVLKLSPTDENTACGAYHNMLDWR